MKVKGFIKNYWMYMLAILCPVILVLVHCITRQTWLFGDGSMLRGEASDQYVYFFEELWNKVHSGDFSFFSRNAVGGFDLYLNALYYAVSPSTIIILMLPKAMLEGALQFFMVVKWALLSFTTVYFFMNTGFNKLDKCKKLVSFTLGMCYALGSFVIYALTFFNWLDTMILFPILLLLIEQMVEKGSWKRFFVTLTVAVCCNFYIAFPICIFLLVWFVMQLQATEKTSKKVWVTFLGSFVWVIVSAMVVLLPCVVNAGNRYVLQGKNGISAYVKSIVELPNKLIERFFVLSVPDSMSEHGFDLYMSIGLVIMSLMFCFVKMNKKVKGTKIACAAFLICSMCVGVLNYFWHGFVVPNDYNLKFGFVFVLLLAVMALDVMSHLEDLKTWNCLVMLIVALGMFCYAFFQVVVFEEYYSYLATVLLIVFYFILLVLFCRKSIKKESLLIAVCILCLAEVFANSYHQLSQYDTVVEEDEHEHDHEDEHAHEEEQEAEHHDEVVDMQDSIQLETGKMVVFSNAGYNAGLSAGVPSMTGSAAYLDDKTGTLLSNLGMSVLQDEQNPYIGGTPLLNMMFNIGYGVGEYSIAFPGSEQIGENHGLNIYGTGNSVGLGYMVKNDVVEWKAAQGSTFEAQNSFAQMAVDIGENRLFDTFVPSEMICTTSWGYLPTVTAPQDNNVIQYQYIAGMKDDGNVISLIADRDMDLYCAVEVSSGATIRIYVEEELVYQNLQNTGKSVLSIGKVKKGDEINIVCLVKDQVGKEITMSAQFAELNEDVWESIHKEASRNVYNITEMTSDYIKGNIKAEESGIMMTSVPALNGFSVYVDGKESSYERIGNALIGVPLEEGEHQVEFYYETPGAKLGWLLSLFGIGAFVIVCLIGRKKNAAVFCETGATE